MRTSFTTQKIKLRCSERIKGRLIFLLSTELYVLLPGQSDSGKMSKQKELLKPPKVASHVAR